MFIEECTDNKVCKLFAVTGEADAGGMLTIP